MLQFNLPKLIAPLLLAAAALLSACGGGPDQTQLERELQDRAGSDILPAELGMVDCPEDIVVAPESVFICATEVAGQYYELQVRIIDAQAQYSYVHKHHPLQLVNTEAVLADEVGYEVGFDVMIDCGDGEYLVAPIGSSFNCVATRVESGAQANVKVTLLDTHGTLKWILQRG